MKNKELHSEQDVFGLNQMDLLRKPAQQWSIVAAQADHYTVGALMKSAHTEADVLTVGIKAVGVIPGDLPLSPVVDLR